jgi:hypothetical protein
MVFSLEQDRPKVICLTPVKNEAWILDRFLKCASLWADHIIIADQQSDDGSREIACSHPKVILIDNPSSTYSELERQKVLLDAARQIPGPRLLIALDADEILSANFMNSPEWKTVLQAPVGTVIQFQWANLLPDLRSYWEVNERNYGFMDDGSEHFGTKIHSPRIPIPAQAPAIVVRDIKVLHYQYTDWERMKSKHRWYQCWERLNQPWRRAIDIYRQYHQMDVLPHSQIRPLPREWLSGYEQQGIDVTSVCREGVFWWDRQILDLLGKHSPETFKREAIWDVDWSALSKKINPDGSSVDYYDPRSKFNQYVHQWLRKTQPIHSRRDIRLIEKVLSFLGY